MCGWASEWHMRTRAPTRRQIIMDSMRAPLWVAWAFAMAWFCFLTYCVPCFFGYGKWADDLPEEVHDGQFNRGTFKCRWGRRFREENSFEGSFDVGEASDDNRDDHRHDEGARLNLFEDMCQNDMHFLDDGGHDAKRDRMIWDGASWIPWRVFCRGGGLAEKLKALLDETEHPTAKSRGKGKGNDTGADGDAKLLKALRKLVDRATLADIGVRQRQLVDAREAGCPLGGRAARKWRAAAAKRQAKAQANGQQTFYGKAPAAVPGDSGFQSSWRGQGKRKGKQGKSDGCGGKSDGKGKTAAGGQGRVLSVDGAAKAKGKRQFDGRGGGLAPTAPAASGGDGGFLLGVLTTQLFVTSAKGALSFLAKENNRGWRWDVVVASSAAQVNGVRDQAKIAGTTRPATTVLDYEVMPAALDLVRRSSFVAPDRSLTVLRASVPKDYLDEIIWRIISDNPDAYVKVATVLASSGKQSAVFVTNLAGDMKAGWMLTSDGLIQEAAKPLAAGRPKEAMDIIWRLRGMPVGWSAEDLPAALQGRHGWRALVDDLLADSSPAAPLRSPSGHVAMQEEGSSKPSDGRDLDDAEGADGKDAEMGVVPDGAAAAPAPPVENSSAGNGGDQPLKKAKSQTDKGDHAWCSIVKCGGQGACFYNSFGAAYGMQKDSMTWDAISKTIWSRGRLSWLEDGPTPKDWDQYVEALKRRRRYVGARFRSRIIVFINEVSPTAQTVVYGQRSGSCAAMMLYAAGHYQLVLPKSGQTVPPWVHLLKDSEDMEHFPRGGGERFQCGSGPRSPVQAHAEAASWVHGQESLADLLSVCQPVKGCLHRSPQCSCQCLELANCERRRIAHAENIEPHPGRSDFGKNGATGSVLHFALPCSSFALATEWHWMSFRALSQLAGAVTVSGALLLVSAGTPGVGVPSIDHCRDIHQAIALQCNDLRVCGLWQRPDHVAAGGLGQYVVEASSAGFLVAVLGDFNATLDENPLQNSGDCVMYVAMENGVSDARRLPPRAVEESGFVNELVVACTHQPPSTSASGGSSSVGACGRASSPASVEEQASWFGGLLQSVGQVEAQTLVDGVFRAMEAVDLLPCYWQHVWHRSRPAFDQWLTAWPVAPEPLAWKGFEAIACGPLGWYPAELREAPVAAFTELAELLNKVSVDLTAQAIVAPAGFLYVFKGMADLQAGFRQRLTLRPLRGTWQGAAASWMHWCWRCPAFAPTRPHAWIDCLADVLDGPIAMDGDGWSTWLGSVRQRLPLRTIALEPSGSRRSGTRAIRRVNKACAEKRSQKERRVTDAVLPVLPSRSSRRSRELMELGLELWSCGPSRVWVVTDFGKLHLIHGDGKKHAVLRYETTSHYTLVQGASENDLWSRAVELNVKGREALSDPMRGGWTEVVTPTMRGAIPKRWIEAAVFRLLSRDLTRAFDFADANHVLAVLLHYGFPEASVSFLRHVLGTQVRHTLLGPYIDANGIIIGKSIPQGIQWPCSPFACCSPKLLRVSNRVLGIGSHLGWPVYGGAQ
ncbi:rbcL, partial [Symbiodinium sp. KB8]